MIINANSPDDMSNLKQEKQKGLVLIWFYATWCGHCSSMESEWDQLENKHPEEVKLSKVESEDYDNYQMSPNEDKVQGYPTVRLYHHDKLVKEFDGERNFQTMYDFIQDYINNNPDTKINNLMLLRGKKTNQHNKNFLKKLRTNKKIKKLSVPVKKTMNKKRKRTATKEKEPALKKKKPAKKKPTKKKPTKKKPAKKPTKRTPSKKGKGKAVLKRK